MSRKAQQNELNWTRFRPVPPHLHGVSFLVVHTQDDLHVLGRLFLPAVKLALQQRDVEVVPHNAYGKSGGQSELWVVDNCALASGGTFPLDSPGRMISGKPIFLTMAVLRSTKCG